MNTAFRAVLVDIDGTLIDSNDAHARAWMKVLADHRHERPYESIRPLIGKGGDKLLADVLGPAVNSIDTEALASERSHLFLTSELHGLKPTRGARALLQRFRAAGIKVIVATSATSTETDALLKQAGVDDLIDAAVNADDAEASKPDPDIVRSALRRSGTRPSEAVMLGDTPYDIEAARSAGVATIIFRCGGWWNDDALANALAIYNDPADLLEAFNASVFGFGNARVAS